MNGRTRRPIEDVRRSLRLLGYEEVTRYYSKHSDFLDYYKDDRHIVLNAHSYRFRVSDRESSVFIADECTPSPEPWYSEIVAALYAEPREVSA